MLKLLVEKNIVIKPLIIKVLVIKKEYFTLFYTSLLFRFCYLVLSISKISTLSVSSKAPLVVSFNSILNFNIIDLNF